MYSFVVGEMSWKMEQINKVDKREKLPRRVYFLDTGKTVGISSAWKKKRNKQKACWTFASLINASIVCTYKKTTWRILFNFLTPSQKMMAATKQNGAEKS